MADVEQSPTFDPAGTTPFTRTLQEAEGERRQTDAPLSKLDGLPIARPANIVCVGLNYRDHAAETALSVPQQPLLFAKWSNSLVGPGAPIVLPDFAREVDYEAELGVVIGRTARNVSADEAYDYVAGFICINDVSARDVQFLDGQWTRGKSFDSFCPVGPELVPLAAVGNPQRLQLRCLVNGEVMQDDSTASMIFPIAELIAYITRGMQLEPGDLIATGTPSGVQLGRDHPRWLESGDVVTVEVEGVGTLTNPVRR